MLVHNLGSIEITDAQIRSALVQAALETGQINRNDAMVASADWTPRLAPRTLGEYRRRLDARAIQFLRSKQWAPAPEIVADLRRRIDSGRWRADALEPGPGGSIRDFEHIRAEILMEERPQLNAMRMFKRDTTVPLGAQTHTAKRVIVAGKARWHKRGEGFPLTKAGWIEESFNTGFVVCAVEQSFFEGLALGFAGLRNYQYEAAGAIRAIEEFLNHIAWYGDPNRNIYGALTYPHLAKMVLSIDLTDPNTTPDQVLDALNAFVAIPVVQSGSVFRPNRLFVSEKVHTYLSTKRITDTDITIKQFFLANQDKTTGIKDIEIAHELDADEMTAGGVGNPAGYHGIFAYNDAKDSAAHVLPQTPTFLPIHRVNPIDTLEVAFASTGGMTMFNVGNNLVGFIKA